MLHREYIYKNSSVYVWKIEETIDEIKSLVFDFLNIDDIERCNNFKLEQRQKEWLLSRYLLKKATNSKDKIIVKYDKYGKPFMDNFFISISHTKKFVTVIISEKHNVSVDIQKITKKTKTVVNKFLSLAEKNIFDTNNLEITSLLWSVKETAYKYYGKNNLPFIDNIKILYFDKNKDKKIKVLINDKINIAILFFLFDNNWLTFTIN